MSTHFNFDKALNLRQGNGQGSSLGSLKEFFDLDDDVTADQVRDMCSFLQKACSSDGLPKPVTFNENLIYEVVGFDEFLQKSVRKKEYTTPIRYNIGDKAKIGDIFLNCESLREQGIAPHTLIDSQGNRWNLVLDKVKTV